MIAYVWIRETGDKTEKTDRKNKEKTTDDTSVSSDTDYFIQAVTDRFQAKKIREWQIKLRQWQLG